ncbi:uncharacterized protein C5L36_0E05320 [Pichia kudriavzevii]|uniref:TUG ubiquitin-like domain-containing protein n=2 Tax=Pichia kudriavzevii TaxID=4909 RepID=A0A2U9RAN9_PICKU|nr:uncharacterized protein C5L36_0E05320 [Pichia kudriavzevii]AWU78475.1 hypothetical protein C5L36_0E05320 [Pichia kudriavzevii]
MPTVNLASGFRTYRTNVNAGTIMSNVLEEGCKHFQLSQGRKYKLMHNDKRVDESVPYRLSNLPQGATLAIEPSDEDNGDQDGHEERQEVIIRGHVCGETVVKKYKNKETLRDVVYGIMRDAQKEGDVVDVQVLMKVISGDSLHQKLKDVGIISGNHSLRIRVREIIKSDTAPEGEMDEDQSENLEENNDNNNGTVEGVGDVVTGETLVYIPQSEGSAKFKSRLARDVAPDGDTDTESDGSPEMSLSQLQKYREMLQRQYSEQPLMTRAMREKSLLEKEKEKEKERAQYYRPVCEMRIKFPNNEVVQITIDKNKTLGDLARTFEEHVLRDELFRHLQASNNGTQIYYMVYLARPFQCILHQDADLQQSIASLQLGNRVSLFFKVDPQYRDYVDTSKGYLKEGISQVTKTGMHHRGTIDPKELELEELDITHNGGGSASSKKMKKVPAWMKLSRR